MSSLSVPENENEKTNSTGAAGPRGRRSRKTRLRNMDKATLEREAERDVASSATSVDDSNKIHLLSIPSLARQFKDSRIDNDAPSHSRGLTLERARTQLDTDGRNELTPPKKPSQIVLFLRQFLNPFMILLNLSGILGLVVYVGDTSQPVNLYLALALFLVVVLTCAMSWWQERSSAMVMEGFHDLLPTVTRVVRDGVETTIPAAELVVGDIVHLGSGEQVPADVRVLACSAMKVETSALTGESAPINVTVNSTSELASDAKNMLFNSSLVVTGDGFGLVVATGMNTVIGKVAHIASSTVQDKTTLEREVDHFVRVITIIASCMALVTFSVAIARGFSLVNAFLLGIVTILVANVPQGLPATVASLQALTAKRMARANVLVKRLSVVETLGCVTLVASDKTGTLTKNVLTVCDLWTALSYLHVGATGILQNDDDSAHGIDTLTKCAVLCNSTKVCSSGELTTIAGNPVDVSLIMFAGFAAAKSIQSSAPVVFEMPFNSRDKFQVTVVEEPLDAGKRKAAKKKSTFTFFKKGAPEIILRSCSSYLGRGGVVPIDKMFMEAFDAAYQRFGGNGARVIGFAQKKVVMPTGSRFETANNDDNLEVSSSEIEPSNSSSPLLAANDFVFVGMCAMMDPPRPGVAEAVSMCHGAGVKVFVITGDHPLTAVAVATMVGIVPGEHKYEMTSRDMLRVRLVSRHREHDASSVRMSTEIAAAVSPINSRWLRDGHLTLLEFGGVLIMGEDVPLLTDDEWAFLLASDHAVVFARTTPQNKLDIVTQCQRHGHIVAVTGDGVNDAPALKKADVGVAMGMAGTAVAREAADLVLTNDSFTAIIDGIEQGRILFDNLMKTIAYTLSHLWPEVVPVLLTIVLSMPLGLSSLLVLAIDLGTELVPAISFSYEQKESNVMTRPPRNAHTDRLVSTSLLVYAYLFVGVLEGIACFAAYLGAFVLAGVPLSHLPFSAETHWRASSPPLMRVDRTMMSGPEQAHVAAVAQSAWFVTLVMSQVWHVWSAKTRYLSLFSPHHNPLSNAVTNVGVLIEVLIMLCIVYIPEAQAIFGTMEVPTVLWIPQLVVLVVLTTCNELRKSVIRRKLAANVDVKRNSFLRCCAW